MMTLLLAGLTPLLILLLVAAIAGLLAGPWVGFAILAAGSAIVVARHLRNVARLERWAGAELDAPVPEGRGAWHAAFTALHRRARTRAAQQRDLAQTIDRFRSAAEAIPDGMVVIDTSNRIRWANARAVAHLGLDLAQDVGQPLSNVARQPEFVRYLEAGEFSESVLVDSQRAGGITLQVQIVPFGVEERLLISRDVTRLEAVSRMRRDFIANISHELKTPLTVVAGFVETLQDMDLEASRRERYLALIGDQARSMQRLVDDLLTLSALESEANHLQESEFAMQPMIEECVADAKVLSAGQHVIDVDAGATANLTGNRDELRSAIGNLLSNAIRYTPAGGTIRLIWRIDHAGNGLISVADSGIGIAPEHIPRLTERFYRVDRSRSRATGGTGLGLAIVKHVLLRHQADLEVTSDLGIGSTFLLTFPARRVRRTSQALAAPTGSALEGAPERGVHSST
jgi:two-component system phosphate regulon sensor histidine kinase PhoR